MRKKRHCDTSHHLPALSDYQHSAMDNYCCERQNVREEEEGLCLKVVACLHGDVWGIYSSACSAIRRGLCNRLFN